MKTRAKFYCMNVLEDADHFYWNLTAVYHDNDPEHENSKFNEASPDGMFKMKVDKSVYTGENPKPGKEYYLDLSEAPERDMEGPKLLKSLSFICLNI